jgi:hypothetical protein
MVFAMSKENFPSIDQLIAEPARIADMQAMAGDSWAALYADRSAGKLPSSAEIVLRNPSVYVHDVSPRQLPEGLQDRWLAVMEFTDAVVQQAKTVDHEWGREVNSLEKLQSLVFSGEIDPAYRGAVGDVMRASSRLFAESVREVPGNTRYYAGNVIAAASWLSRQ